jgi:hypothetical protein
MYGSLALGTSFSNVNLSSNNTFYGIRSFYVSNDNFLDIDLKVIGNQIAVSSLNTKMNSLIIDYIVINVIIICGRWPI